MKTLLITITLLYSLGSLAQKKIPDKTKMCKVLKEMMENDQLQRSKLPSAFTEYKSEYSKKEIDSMKLLQRKIDNYNTEKLIDFTKEYGWISDERIDCPELNIWIILRHSQPEYFEEISELIEKEHDEKRLKYFHYTMVKDHINGRPRG